MITPEERRSILDEEHLRLLSIGYYILGGTNVLFGFLPLLYVGLGAIFINGFGGIHQSEELNPAFMGWLFVIIGAALSIAFFIVGTLQFVTGRSLKRREARTLCLITAAITCLSIPLGTAVGVFTFIVLRRQSVELMFDPMYKASRVVEPHVARPPPENLA